MAKSEEKAQPVKAAKPKATKKVAKKAVAKKSTVKKAATKKAPAPRSTAKKTAQPNPAPVLAAGKNPLRISAEERWRMVATAAYFRAEKRKFSSGHEVEDWLAAEAEIDALLSG